MQNDTLKHASFVNKQRKEPRTSTKVPDKDFLRLHNEVADNRVTQFYHLYNFLTITNEDMFSGASIPNPIIAIIFFLIFINDWGWTTSRRANVSHNPKLHLSEQSLRRKF